MSVLRWRSVQVPSHAVQRGQVLAQGWVYAVPAQGAAQVSLRVVPVLAEASLVWAFAALRALLFSRRCYPPISPAKGVISGQGGAPYQSQHCG